MTSFNSFQITRSRKKTTRIADLDRKFAELRFKIASLRLSTLLQKFDPDQPRDDLGRWTDGTTNGHDAALEAVPTLDDDLQGIVAEARRLNLAASPNAMSRCIDLCYRILERPRVSDHNEWDFRKCLNACLGLGR